MLASKTQLIPLPWPARSQASSSGTTFPHKSLCLRAALLFLSQSFQCSPVWSLLILQLGYIYIASSIFYHEKDRALFTFFFLLTFTALLLGHKCSVCVTIYLCIHVYLHAHLKFFLDFPGGPMVKNPPANAGDTGSIPNPGRLHMPQGTCLIQEDCISAPNHLQNQDCTCLVAPQLLSQQALEPVLCNKRNHSNEKPMLHS